MEKTGRAIVGFAAAPFVPACLYWGTIAFPSAPVRHLHAFLLDSAAVVFRISVLVTLPITLAVGVPVYVLFEKRASLRRQHVLVTSGVVGAAVGLFLATPPIGALLGLSAGLTFCLIWYRARDERRPF